MRSVLQLGIIFVSCFTCTWMQIVETDVLSELFMPERDVPNGNYSNDSSLSFVNVEGLSRLEFGLRGCSGARIILLQDPNNLTDFLEFILGKDDNSITQISECHNESSCEIRNSSPQQKRPMMYCFGYITFWVNFRSPSVAIGIRDDRSRRRWIVLTSWTPPSSSSYQLDSIRYVGFSNEKEELSFLISRNAGTNVCYVQEDESTSIRQCGDNFYGKESCTQCGCCYQEHRQPPCFYSMVPKEVPFDRCLRSIEELSDGIAILAQTPSYVDENVTFLLLIGTHRPTFSYVVEFEANESMIVHDVFELRPRIPRWAYGHLPVLLEPLLKPDESGHVGGISQELEYYGVEVSHVYNDTGHFAVSFSVSGQLTLRNDLETYTAQALVEIRRRPTLSGLLNETLLVSRSLAFSNETTKFVFFLQNNLPDLSYDVDFDDGSKIQAFNSSSIETRNSTKLPHWLLTDNNTFYSINSTDGADGSGKTPAFLSQPMHHLLLFDHVYLKPGRYVVSVNVSGHIPAVNKHDQHITTLSIDVRRRPALKELVDGLVFVASSPAYENEAISFAVLVENKHPSLSAGVEFGDESACLLLPLTQSVSTPAWLLTGNFLHTAVGINDSQLGDFLNSTQLFVGHEFNHTYAAIGNYNLTIDISGYQPLVLKSDTIRIAADIEVKSRPTLSQAIGRLLLLVDSPVYVSESTTFWIGTQYFYPELTYTLNFGDSSSQLLFKTSQIESLSDWSRSKYKRFDHVDIFPSVANTSGYRLEIVEHVYKSVGSYSASLIVTGALEVVRKCDSVFLGLAVQVQRRPSLSEVVQNDVVLIAEKRVYTNQDASVFLLHSSNFSNLSYTIDCGDGSAVKVLSTKWFTKVPDWITNGSHIFATVSMQPNTFPLTTGPFFSATTSCRYKKPNNLSITLNVSGKVEPVGKFDFHQSSIPVSILSRPTLSEKVGRLSMFLRTPVFALEKTNCIVAVENYFSNLRYSISTDRDVRLSKKDLIFRQNVSFPDWIERKEFYTPGGFSNDVIPNNAYWADINVTFLKSKAFEVTFNLSGQLETVGRWENVTRRIQVFAVEMPKLSELLKDKCKIIANTSALVVEQILGFVFLCSRNDHVGRLRFTVSFGDDSPEEKFLVSSEFILPNWIRAKDDPITRKLIDAAQQSGGRTSELHKYTGAAIYHMYQTTGTTELRVIVSADGEFRVNGSREFIIRDQVSIGRRSPPVLQKPPVKCRPYAVSIRGGGASYESPGLFRRNDPIRLEAVTHADCLVGEEETFIWEMDEEGPSKYTRLLKVGPYKDSVDKRKLMLDAYSLRYGKYKIVVKVSVGNASQSDSTVRDETWISIEPSPLHVELLGGPVVVTDYLRDVTITAVHYEDVDDHPNVRSSRSVFTWFCTTPNDELPQDPLNRRYHGSNSGCFGKGLLLSKGTNHSLLFQSDRSIFRSLPTVFIVHVFISKPGRAATSSQQAVIVLQKGPPSIRIVCLFNCDEVLKIEDDLVLNATCLDCTREERLEFLWEVESMCQLNAIKESDWKRNLSSQNSTNQLVVRPGVFSQSPGADFQYRIKVTVTRRDRSQSSALYIIQSHSLSKGNPSELSKDSAVHVDPRAALVLAEVSAGHRGASPSSPSLHLLQLLVFLTCARSYGSFF